MRRRRHALVNKHTPDHGREPCAPCDSGNNANSRIQNDNRLSIAPVFSSERTSLTFQP